MCECVSVNVCLPLPQEVADGSLVQTLLLVQERGHRWRFLLQQVVLHQVLDALHSHPTQAPFYRSENRNDS